MNKYKLLTSESKEVFGNKVYRIQALKNFIAGNNRKVKKNDKGGWVQSESNLSQEGSCWLFDEAVGMENSRRFENAVGYGDSQQYGNSRQSGNSWQSGDSWQSGNSQQYGDMKCETGYYFAYKEKSWNITEIDMGDGGICLVRDYQPPKGADRLKVGQNN